MGSISEDYDSNCETTKKKKKSKKDVINNTANGGNDKKVDVEVQETFVGRYLSKLQEDVKQSAETVSGPADSVQPSQEVKQSAEASATKDTGKLDKIEAPSAVDVEAAIDDNHKKEKKSAGDAASKSRPRTAAEAYRAMVAEEAGKASHRDGTASQKHDDNWSPKAKAFAAMHNVDTPGNADINVANRKNSEEVHKSLARRVDYRHNDQKTRIESVEHTNESFNHFMSHSGMHAAGSHAVFKGSDGNHHTIHAKERNTAKGGKVITINGKEHSREEAAKKVGNQQLKPRAGHPEH